MAEVIIAKRRTMNFTVYGRKHGIGRVHNNIAGDARERKQSTASSSMR